MVAIPEADDCRLCPASADVRRRFARDLHNLTLPTLKRNPRDSPTASPEWLPERNCCCFAAAVVAVRKEYGLTIDRRKAAALNRILAGCEPANLVSPKPSTTTPHARLLGHAGAGVGCRRRYGADGMSTQIQRSPT